MIKERQMIYNFKNACIYTQVLGKNLTKIYVESWYKWITGPKSIIMFLNPQRKYIVYEDSCAN